MIRVERPSRYAAERFLIDIQDALDGLRNGSMARMESVAWPAGLSRTVLHALPIEVRTRNCLQRERLMEGDNPLTVQELLRVPNFGWKSLRDLLFTVENFLSDCIRIGSADSAEASEPNERTPATLNETVVFMARTETFRTPWDRAGQLLSPLLATAAELHGAKRFADVLNPDFMRLAGKMGIAGAIGAIRIDYLANGTPGLVAATLARLSRTLDAASDTECTVIEYRLLRTPPATLEAVGSQVGVTRERIRQVQARIERKIHAVLGRGLRVIAMTMKEPLGHMVSQSELEDRIEQLLPGGESLATRILRKALLNEMGFTLDNGLYLDERAMEQLEHIRASIRKFADDVGLVDEQQLVASLPSAEWKQWWPWVREHCGLHDLLGSLGIRDSGKARAKAALISIGHPATREEIARLCGFGENKTGSHLSVIPSVVKADKDRWGLKDWVDDEYEGIVGEIIQRIEEDGGATTTERLLEELPTKFGVAPASVRAYMQTPKFVIRNGWVSLANTSSIQLRDLDDVIDGRDHGGAPYWTFTVEDRFFDGYSVAGVPPEFAKTLGCAPDAGERVRIDNLPDCLDLSIRWPLASTTGASLGYLAEPLKHLGLESGQRARVTIKGRCLVELSADDGNPEESRTSEAGAILERMMQRRRVL